jgi:CRP/FNR family cyclic AMP-dependent transcriptional regulator
MNPFSWNNGKAWSMQSHRCAFPVASDEHNGPSSDAGAIVKLQNVGRLDSYLARAVIFHHGDPATSVFIVRQGRLKLSLCSRRGRSVVFGFAVAGDVLGLSAVLNETDHEFSTQTLEPSVLANVRRDGFLELFQTSPEVNKFATQALARAHRAMLRGIGRLGQSAPVRERLAQLLINCLEFPRKDCVATSIRMNWTYGELADMVNSSRETVTRIMGQFEGEELITRRGSLLVIRNLARLTLLAS